MNVPRRHRHRDRQDAQESRSQVPRWAAVLGVCALVVAAPATSRADSHQQGVTAQLGLPLPPLALGLAGGQPAMLDNALGQGLTLGATPWVWLQRGGARLVLGGEFVWLHATEHSPSWQVTHDDLRLRVVIDGELHRGRGMWLLRFGAGATTVLESRLRHQSERLVNGGISERGVALLPAADVQVGVAVRVIGNLGLRLRVGPSVHVRTDGLGLGVVGALEAAWLP